MSWIKKLYETYENCQSSIGYSDVERQRPLLPICHTTAQAHIEIIIDNKGEFKRADFITDKKDATTIIPCTEASASRAGSKPENHPLCDKLQYLAGDFVKYGGEVTSGFEKNPIEPYQNYLESLSRWCDSKYSHPKIEAVLAYVQKKTLIQDLVAHGILLLNNKGVLAGKNEVSQEYTKSGIFTYLDTQNTAFVRWIVETPGSLERSVWKDKVLWENWIKYYLSDKKAEPICFVSGKEAILSTNHPRYIRREGDGAKLISANDTSGFTFRGRFLTDQQACNVSLEVSQKSHYALSWLLSRQGYRKDDLAVVAWATSGREIIQPTDGTPDILGISELAMDELSLADTAQTFALKLKKKIAGYTVHLGKSEGVGVIALDSATTGRLAITYYRELDCLDYLERLQIWHSECSWIHDYGYDAQSKRGFRFIGAPTPNDIAEAAYGPDPQLDEKLRKATIERLLPSIIDGQPIPYDLVESAYRRACNRFHREDRLEREWNKTLSIACALYRKYVIRKENFSMTLELDRKTRDYLYGRLLALAESLENWALHEAHEKRGTNAARLMQRFSEHPYSTWRTIELSLVPYKVRLGPKSTKRQRMIDEVIASFNPEDFINDRRLSGEFLLGYHCQREYLQKNRIQSEETEDSELDTVEEYEEELL